MFFETLVIGTEFILYKAKKDLRQLSPIEEPTLSGELRELAKLLPTASSTATDELR